MTPADASDADRSLAAARRRAAREHHPDRGGDPSAYLDALARIEAAHRLPSRRATGSLASPTPVTVVSRRELRRRRVGLLTRWARRRRRRYVELPPPP